MRYWRALCLPATLKRGREVYPPDPAGALPPDPRPCRGLVRGLMLSRSHFGVLDGSIYPCGMGGMGLPLLRVGYRGDMGCTQRSQPTCVINRLPTDLDARSTLRTPQ